MQQGGMQMKGEMTVVFSLVFMLMISFSGAILESASLQTLKNEKREDMSLAMDSVFAEYQKELFEHYDIFTLDASYETGTLSEDAVGSRLNFYSGMRAEQEIIRMELLTDFKGQAFYEQAVRYGGSQYGADVLEAALELKELWKEKEETLREDSEQETEAIFEKAEAVLPSEENALSEVIRLNRRSLAEKVLPEGQTLSARNLSLSELPSHRTLKKGRGEFQEQVLGSDAVSDLLFEVYLEKHFGTAVSPGKDTALAYEMEYLFNGAASDAENLEAIVRKILWIRFACNFAYLQTDAERKEKAALWAAGISTLLLVPEGEEVVRQAILLAWAYGESVQDLRRLMAGRKVPFWKTSEDWQTGIMDLIRIGQAQTVQAGDGEGFSYMDYLRCLYLLEEKEKIRMRALDLIEQNLRGNEGTSFLCMDACINKMEVQTKCHFRRGISWCFRSYYEYM